MGTSAEDYFADQADKGRPSLNETGDMVGDKYRIPCDRCDGAGVVGYNCTLTFPLISGSPEG